jgi:hypothetical protein
MTRRVGRMRILVADLGWAPRHSDIAGIVRDAWESAQERA